MSRYHKSYGGDPRSIVTRYAGTCNGCGAPIGRGERVFYYPSTKSVYSFGCGEGCGEAASADFYSAAQDEAMLGG